MTTTRVTTSSDGMSRDSWNPSLSADGTKVAFESDSSFPGHTIPDNQFEIWLYDRVARTYTRVTTSTPASRVSENPSLNEDGTVIAFASDSAFWGGTIPVAQLEIWLYDIPSATFTRVTTGTTAYLPGLAQSNHPSLSGDGTRIAFESNTNFLNPSEGTRTEIWLYDTQTLTFTRVTTASGSDRESLEPAISLDGTKIAFQSDSNLAGHVITAEHYEIWLYDIAAMTYTRVTTSTGSGYRWSTTPSLDRTGSQVIFSSDSDLLHEGIGDNMHEIWRYDVPTGQLTRLTRNSNTNRDSWLPRISANGRLIAFVSDSNLLNVGLSDDQYEFWLYDSRERIYLPLVLR
jgi:Tol biopolymer transport system component